MSRRPRNGRKEPGPNIIRAWFDTVFQYLLGRLAGERPYLASGNWTFRAYKSTLDFVSPLGDFMPANARDNLEQFASFYPAITSLIEEHDRKVNELTGQCIALHNAILRSQQFQESFAKVEREAAAEFGIPFEQHFGALSEHGQFAELLAEYLVNGVGTLPDYYATSHLWNRFRDRFATVMTAPEVESLKAKAERIGQEIIAGADRLRDLLKSTRSELSLEYDVPYAVEAIGASKWQAND
jgi:hypothetical protein